MATYAFSPEYMISIMDHANNLKCVIESLTLDAGRYTMICTNSIDADQFAHLQGFSDIEAVD